MIDGGGVKVQLINDNLTRIEYCEWLGSCDLILLPYDRQAYSERTSGIFTECTIAGKIPIVTPNTWMANELSKYGLEKLAFEWQKPEIVVGNILEIAKDVAIKAKIDKMRRQYNQFHSIDQYVSKMKELFYCSHTT